MVFNEQYLVVWWLLNERGLLILRFDVKKQIVFECKMTVGDRILTPGGAAELMRGGIEPVLTVRAGAARLFQSFPFPAVICLFL